MLTGLRPPDAYRSDNIVEMHKARPGVETPTDEILCAVAPTACRSGAVPRAGRGPGHLAADLSPKHAATPTPAIYRVHGGGMIVEKQPVRPGRDAEPGRTADGAWRWSRSSTGSHRDTPTRSVEDCYAGLVSGVGITPTSSTSTLTHRHRRCERRRRPRGGCHPDGTRPQRPGHPGPAAPVADAGRPQRFALPLSRCAASASGTAPRTRPGGTRSSATAFAGSWRGRPGCCAAHGEAGQRGGCDRGVRSADLGDRPRR